MAQIIKTILLGDAGVGKTTILSVYCDDIFVLNYAPTIGVDFQNKKVAFEGRDYVLQIWDTAGQERFRSITQNYYRGAQVVFLVVDVTRSTTLRSVSQWLIDIDRSIPNNHSYKLIVVGNKIDGQVAEGYFEMTSLLEEKKIDYFPVSALRRIGIQELFEDVIKDLRVREPEETLSDLRSLSLEDIEKTESNRCC